MQWKRNEDERMIDQEYCRSGSFSPDRVARSPQSLKAVVRLEYARIFHQLFLTSPLKAGKKY
jgi:hypothetical protein